MVVTVCKKCDKTSNALFSGICDKCSKKDRLLEKKQRNYIRKPDKKLMEFYPTRAHYFKEKYG